MLSAFLIFPVFLLLSPYMAIDNIFDMYSNIKMSQIHKFSGLKINRCVEDVLVYIIP